MIHIIYVCNSKPAWLTGLDLLSAVSSTLLFVPLQEDRIRSLYIHCTHTFLPSHLIIPCIVPLNLIHTCTLHSHHNQRLLTCSNPTTCTHPSLVPIPPTKFTTNSSLVPIALHPPTPHLHYTHPPLTCTTPTHPSLALHPPTPHLHYTHPPLTCTTPIHPSLALHPPTPHLHYTHPPLTCTTPTHPSLALHPPTPHLHYTHPPLTALHPPTPHLLHSYAPLTCSPGLLQQLLDFFFRDILLGPNVKGKVFLQWQVAQST